MTAEIAFAAWLQGLTVAEYVAGRDPISGTVYLAMLAVFAAMPLLVARRGRWKGRLGSVKNA